MGRWFEYDANRIVKQDTVNDVNVSTVFLAMDHALNGGTPILFETMIFGGEFDQAQARCSTYDEAEKNHGIALSKVKDYQKIIATN